MATRVSSTKHTGQNVLNHSYDGDLDLLMVEPMGFDGVNAQRPIAKSMNMKVTEDGTTTYIAKAAPGTAQATAKWQAMKIDESSGTVITWADGDASFDNSATDLTALSYS